MLANLLREDPSLILATDQYELTMAKAYWKSGMAEREAVFHMFFRSNPFKGGFVVMAGLETLMSMLESFRFSKGDLDYLSTLKDSADNQLFEDEFLAYLDKLRFNCDLYAMEEGTLAFPNEPLVRVQGPILQAQLLESILLNTLNFQSLIATKAARVCMAAQGEPVVDFGLRRAQGIDGAFSASRASYIGGCVGTSNVLAGKALGLPVMGTHAHSWVMAFDDEKSAFEAFHEAMPDNCIFLVDTYGTMQGLQNAIEVGLKMKKAGHHLIGVRLDSGDLAYFSKQARVLLDEAGLEDTKIMGSSDLDEYLIRSLKSQGAKINAWGVGTNLVTGKDEPALTGVYKLSSIRNPEGSDWNHKLKISETKFKTSIPGILDLLRFRDAKGNIRADAITDVFEDSQQVRMIIDPNDHTNRKRLNGGLQAESLLKPIYLRGVRKYTPPPIEKVRERTLEQLSQLDESHKRFENPHIYPVGLSIRVNQFRDEMITREKEHLLASG